MLSEALSESKSIPWRLFILLGFFLAAVAQYRIAQAGYGNQTTDIPSLVDPAVVAVDEQKFLGVKIPANYVLQNAAGKEFNFSDMLGKPLLLVFSYYQCDGSCPVINKTLFDTLNKVNGWRLGEDYRALTISFDDRDDPISLDKFLQYMDLKNKKPDGWVLSTMKNKQDIKKLTRSLGFKFFWQPHDRVFLHPSIYYMLSPEGRVTRMLYPHSISAADVALAITKAFGNEVVFSGKNLINLMVSTCFSYNFEDGKYTLNYPMFIAWGALIFGFAFLVGGSIIMKRRVKI